MKKLTTRLISIVLALVFCVQMLPLPAMAALLDNDPAYNQEILNALTEIVGSEDEAERYYALLDHYGLLDEDGNLSESWEIWMDGKQVTLEEIREALAAPGCDLDKYVLVDGQPITLGNIKTILEIEEYLAYLQETYFDGHQWTAEQQASLQSLINQIKTSGITLTADNGTPVGGSGVSHSARVVVGTYPVITAEGDNTTNHLESPDKMFDGLRDTKWYSTKGMGNDFVQEFPLWVQIELAEAVTVGSYGIVTGNDRPERDPYTWTLFGSNNGTSWTTLDTQTEYTFTVNRSEEEIFTLAESDSYRYFRIQIDARKGGEDISGYGVQISEMNFYDADGARIATEQTRYRAELTGANPGQTVSFDWAALSGSQPVSGSGTVEMTADASGSAFETFEVDLTAVTTDTVQSSAGLVYYIKLDSLTNALFQDGSQHTVLVEKPSGTVSQTTMNQVVKAAKGSEYTYSADNATDGSLNKTFTLTEIDQYARRWGSLDQVSLKNYNWNTQSLTPGASNRTAWVDTVSYTLSVNNTQRLSISKDHRIRSQEIGIFRKTAPGEQPSLQEMIEAKTFTALQTPTKLSPYKLGGYSGTEEFQLTANGSHEVYESGFKGLAWYQIKGTYDIVTGDLYWWESEPSSSGSGIGNGTPLSCTVVFKDSTKPSVTKISAPAGTYYPGQVVPVTVTFSEPVNAANAKIRVRGQTLEYSAADTNGYSNVLTFPYTVQALDDRGLSVSDVTATDAGGNKLSAYNPGTEPSGLPLEGVVLETPNKVDAITGISAVIGGTITANTLDVTVGIIDDDKITQWMSSETDENGKFYAEGMTVSLDGGKTMYNLYFAGDAFSDGLTASIPLELNTGEEALYHMAELYLDGELLIGKCAVTEQIPVIFITEEDLSVTINTSGYAFENPTNPVIYVQSDMPVLAAYFSLSGEFTFGDTGNTAVAGTEAAETADFIWKSSDTTVAAIDANGNITPTGKGGSATITLTARNGGVVGKAVTVTATYTVGEHTHDTLQFAAGLTPFLLIPNDTITVTDGADATVYWTSNLCDKNGETPTVFTVTIKQGLTEVYSVTVSGTAEAPAASVEIPGEVLSYDYSAVGSNTYTVTVSAVYEGVTYSAEATMNLEAQPAQVSLGKLDSYYILDAGFVSIPWFVEYLDRAHGDVDQNDIFRFQITRNDENIPTDVSLALSPDGSASGVFSLPIQDITANPADPTSYRDVYTVTIQAKNGIQSTWSYDSFLLYVYDEDALKIMVDGAAINSTTMSNVSAISKMDQAQILALKRDIYLKNIISINYGDYAWTEVADQIAWASSNSAVASINYQQGTLYENIENFTYVSYRPTTEFGLSGLNDGTVTITAQHKLTGMDEELTVSVETLENKLYLFQCYPQVTTTLRYQDSTGEWKEAVSDESGAAAIFEENGIHSDVYCAASTSGGTYLGTFYLSDLESGEGDWTKLERYPCNNLTMRRAAYAYLYLKNPDGTPYTGSINFRGGVYVDGEYVKDAQFGLNSSRVSSKGYEDNAVALASDGKLTVTMDQTQWPGGKVSAQDDVQYVFEIARPGDTEYYPLLQTVNAKVNIDAYVGSGEAVVTFRRNPEDGKHPFIAVQTTAYTGYGKFSNVLDTAGNVGPNSNFEEAVLTTSVMWWGEDMAGCVPTLQFVTDSRQAVAAESGQYNLDSGLYPFTSSVVTKYVVDLNKTTLDAIPLGRGKSTGLVLEYYPNGERMSRQETMPFRLINLIGVSKIEQAGTITDALATMGQATDTNQKQSADLGDMFVNIALDMVAGDSYSTGDNKAFRIQLAPTSDPTKFLGFIEVNVGNMRDKDQVTGIYAPGSSTGERDVDYMPGLNELMVMAGKRSFDSYLGDDLERVRNHQGVRNLKAQLGGYAESLIYYSEVTGNWEIQILNGGFNLGGGVTYSKSWNWMAGPVPFTVSLTIGGSMEVSMDALSVAYYNANKDVAMVGNDYLTQLRIYLYLHFFAGVGIDYAVIAFKLGIFGQISLDMQFAWLNRPYMDVSDKIYNLADGTYNDSYDTGENKIIYRDNGFGYEETIIVNIYESPHSKLNGQHFKIDGQIGLEFVVRFLFFNFEKILFSYSFNLLNAATGQWDKIQSNWKLNKEAQMSAISSLLGNKSLSVSSVDGQQMMTLNLAPTLESRDYLKEGSFWNDGSISTFALDAASALQNLQYNSYPYANPVVTDDGAIVVYLSDMNSTDVEDTRASFAVRNVNGMYDAGTAIDDAGFGDSQVTVAGSGRFAAAAWTRQMADINKDAGAVLTTEDQMIMMNSSEIYAAVYNGSRWATTRLTDNGSADLAPVVAANGSRAMVAWRAVESSGEKTEDGFADVANFDEKDTILYRIYDGTEWSQTYTLYNGTSGAVKGITAAMLHDGTAAVAYTLDTDMDDNTIVDREIYYAVVDESSGEVSRNVRATNDAYLDENPQLTTVAFSGAKDEERFVLGWYTEQAVANDTAVTLDGGEQETAGETTADIRLMDFNENGIYTQLLPDSISQAATAYDVSITPSFRFTKNADSITDLSILWVERAAELDRETEKDTLKGVKFYTYGQHDELISFTGAVDVAEMGDGTLIDHFDAYVSDAANNEIKAVILGTTYGADGIVTRIGTTVGGDTVQYSVPSRTTSMYTATETYQDKIEVPAVLADYETIRKGAKTEILFTVVNQGIHAVNKLEITLTGGHKTTYEDLNLLPGSMIQLYADYIVPTDRVVDLDYTVQATFDEDAGASGGAETFAVVAEGRRTTTQDLTQATGKVYLDLPDVEITEASIIREENGERTILVKLNNDSDADLAGSNRTVRIGFYSDTICETPIAELDPILVADDADLTMIDEGGYSVSKVFDVKAYLEAAEDEDLTEIPDSGIHIFVKAEVLEDDEVLPEVILSNNTGSVVCENLKVRTGKDAIVTSTLTNDENGSTVTVNLQNTRLSETASGNVIVTLLDKDGNVLGQQQSYNGTDGLITLSGEQRKTTTVTFAGETFKNAESVQVVYSDLILDTDNADLTSLSFSNIPGITLDSFVEAEESVYRATVVTKDLASTSVMAVAASGSAKITLPGMTDGSNAISENVNLVLRKTQDITITVTNGTAVKTYVLTVQNGSDIPIRPSVYRVTVDTVKNGSVSANPTQATIGSTITLTVTPDAGYKLEHLTVTNQNGRELALTGKSEGEYTFRMPGSDVTVKATFSALAGSGDCTGGKDCPSVGFVDVDIAQWYHKAVDYAVSNKLMIGYGNGRFGPDDTLTRGMMMQILYNLNGQPEVRGDMPFTDVSEDRYYADAIKWASANGIVNGYGGGLFGPDDNITREQLAVILWRYAESPAAAQQELNFTDAGKCSDWAMDALLWANENGIMVGNGNGILNPKGGASRTHVAQMLMNYLK